MKQKLISLFLICLFLSNCSNHEKNSKTNETNNSPYEISLKEIAETDKVRLLSADITNLTCIPLETNKHSVLKKIHRLLVLKNAILVTDYFNLYMFDSKGKYIKKISQMGGGPADYDYVINITSNPSTGGFYLFADRKFLEFDKNGNFMTSTPLDEPYFYGVRYEDQFFLSTPASTIVEGDTTTLYSFTKADTLGHILNKRINPNPRLSLKTRITFGVVPIYRYKDELRYTELWNDTIYTTTKNSETPYTILNWGKMKLDVIMDLTNKDGQAGIENYLKELRDKYTFLSAYESEKYIYLTLVQGIEGDKVYCAYNKQTRTIEHLSKKKLENDIDGGAAFFPEKIEYDGTVLSWKLAEDFKDEILSKDYDKMKKQYGEKFEKIYQLAKSLKEDDNPVIMMALNSSF